jgi:hypothetical protein
MSIKARLQKIDIILNDLSNFRIILSGFSFEENYQLKDDFFDSIQLGSITNDIYKSNLYEGFLGWVVSISSDNWKNGKEAEFTKKDFEEKHEHLRRLHPLKRAIFRNKSEIPEFATIDIGQTRNDTYIQQILDIDRDSDDKDEIVKDAILNFILSEIEISHLISKSNSFTKPDYEDLKDECYSVWKRVKKKYAPLDARSYSETDQNAIAIKIFDEIMDDIKINFFDDFNFDSSDKYVQNGTFLQLSDEPKIGWIPSWQEKYKK